ncbi:MAG: SDR family NAD(P)-dependent oxidoreductase [Luteolibacter sp.]
MNEEGQLIVVTGASRGLGLAISKHCLEAGYRVVGASRKASAEFDALARQFPDRAWFHPLDLKDSASLHEWARMIEEQHGTPYGLINNGAMAHDGVLATMHESQIDELLQVNITGTITLTKYMLRPMLVNRCGRVINIASIIASTGFNGLSVYGASKAALLGFTRSLAREVGRAKITVNAVSPGYMATEMTAGLTTEKLKSIIRRSPLGELAEVDDVAAAVIYLLSPEAKRVTGIDLTVDAGGSI